MSAGCPEYDYVIAGGGTAGCVLAGRLSKERGVTVLLVEAGRRDRNPLVRIPAGSGRLPPGVYDWGLSTVPQAHCQDRRIPFPQAKVLGGGGSMNALVFTRGAAADYDRWASDHGCTGWAFRDVLPYFVRLEANSRLSAPLHGLDGPLAVSDLAQPHPLSLAFVRAGQEYGLPYNADFNGANQFGVGLYQLTTRRGLRCSTARAYLAERRPNLRVMTRRLVNRVLFEGDRAVGLEVVNGGELLRVRAKREVLLAAGAIGSPKILQLSGVGDPPHLKGIGVAIHQGLAGVGRNLQDHCAVDMVYELNARAGLGRFDRPRPAAMAAALQYIVARGGPFASNLVEAGAFSTVSNTLDHPDVQFHFMPTAGSRGRLEAIRPGYGAKLDTYFLRPRSRGMVLISSSSPLDPPHIDPAYLREDYDVEMSVAAVKQGREIMAQPSMACLVKTERVGEGSRPATQDDYVRLVRRSARTAYHPVGTCAMGATGNSVVGPDLKVHGLRGLRVIDASVMPAIVSSNTQAATVMIAEKGADLVLAEV